MTISVHGLTKRFGRHVALDNVSFDVPDGDLVALLGPSGGGKSTILRIIAGLETADAGTVVINGEQVDTLHARDRGIGFVFQHYALFRHMTIAENIAFGLTVRGAPKQQRDARVDELLEIMSLTGLGPRMPAQLSGGQRQRVALARALAPAPSVLLLDEPFAAVDAKVRAELRSWLRRLHDELHVTSLFVTHDQEEAFSVSDRVVLVNKGRIEQVGTPHDVLESPSTEFVARFVGDVNVVDAVIEAGKARAGALVASVDGLPDATKVRLVIRSYDMKFWRDDTKGIATVERIVPLGDRVRVEALLPDVGHLFAHFPRRSSLLKGVSAGVKIAIEVTLARAYPAS
jgi:sulfate/thiosulfate transport system ATP-binding protein